MSAIVKAEPSALDTLVTPEFPRTVLDIALRQVCPAGMPDDEKYVFLKKCSQTGLNPLVGEALCIPRNDKHKGKVFTFQPTYEGMRSRAARFPDFLKIDGDAIYENDFCEIDHSTGIVTHRYNAAKKRGNLVAAWGRVVKRDGTTVIHVLPERARSGTSDFWTKDAGGMLRKCACVAALREAYPVAFAGTYIAEEMPQERAEPTPLAALPPPPPDVPRCEFKPHKGRRLSDLTDEEKREALTGAEAECAKPEAAKWNAKLRANVEKAMAELRAALPPEPEKPTPDPADDLEEVREPTDEEITAERAARAKPGSQG